MAELSVYEVDALTFTVIKAAFEEFWEMSVEVKDIDRGGSLYRVMKAAEKAVAELIDNDFKFPGGYQLPPPEPINNQDVHTEHCCGKHKRCKYGAEDWRLVKGLITEDELCTVATGKKAPSFPCNCNWM